MAKNTGKVREFCQSGKVGTLNSNKLLLAGNNYMTRTTCRRVITSNDIHEPCLSSCRPQIINNIQFPSRCLGDSK